MNNIEKFYENVFLYFQYGLLSCLRVNTLIINIEKCINVEKKKFI